MSNPADGRHLAMADGVGMTYVMTTTTEHGDLETFRKVNARCQGQADGLVALYAGTTDRGLAITAVWESKAQSDRFTTEHLEPAIREIVGDTGGGGGLFVDFEVVDELGPNGTP